MSIGNIDQLAQLAQQFQIPLYYLTCPDSWMEDGKNWSVRVFDNHAIVFIAARKVDAFVAATRARNLSISDIKHRVRAVPVIEYHGVPA